MVTLESLQENGAAEMDDSCSMSAYSVSDNDDGHVDSSEGSSSAAKHSRASENIETTIAKTETRAVARTRIFVAFILVISMIAVAVLIYIFTSKGEQDKFEQKFEDDSTQILETIGSTLDVTLSSTDAFIANIMAYARYSNSTWPFVTKPEYAVEAAKLLVLSKAVYIGEYVFVEEEEKLAWQNYSVNHDSWVQEGIDLQRRNPDYKGIIIDEFQTLGLIHDNFAQERIGGPYMPTWQVAPVVPIYFPYNWDASTHERMGPTIKHIFEKQHVVIGAASGVADPNNPDQILQAEYDALWIKNYISEDDNPSEPFSEIYYPMIDAPGQVRIDVDQPQDIVGFSVITFFWRDLIRDILYEDSKGVVVVIENSCNQVWTYQIDGPNTTYLGPGDLHDFNFDGMRRSAPLYNLRELFSNSGVYTGIPLGEDYCVHTLHVYPSTAMRNEFITHGPIIYTVSAVAFFVLTLLAFLVYDWKVERRQKKVMATAVQTSKIVSSLFPSNVRDRLFQGRETGEHGLPFVGLEPQKRRLKSFLSSGSDKSAEAREVDVDRPIADLFPNCTVMFADISGFTAWSSVREPAQVFRLLETLYGAFDEIANKRRVFKVETIGDSYVAVTGLPEPRKDHAVVMARYAFDCRSKMAELTKQLETTLGPDTGDLQFRFGLNSGPVTAGVLRGEKTRFQLFGDTVNTAARMESSGARSKIQCSQTTADSLVEAGKEHWLKARSELVEAKGKGRMQTFWIEPREHQASHVSSAPSAEVAALFDEKTQRLVDWNTDVLARLIRQVVALRNVSIKGKKKSFKPSVSKIEFQCDLSKSNGTALDEVREIIELPEFDHSLASKQEDPDSINLGQDILGELREYIVNIASMYHNNPFHNFEHASHVTMSVVKLLSRIVAPDEVYSDAGVKDSHKLASSLHDHTYGITSDPLTQFACVFSALIHDVDHSGVPNAQLVKERTHIASFYKGKSVAEQNSVDIAWDLLMSDSFQKLRTKIASNPDELRRFRQLVVNSVMATDIMDKDLGAARKARWNKAFAQGSERAKEDTVATNSRDDINRKATIVIEHLIQASDVSHTMQHWHIYRKWNERFFIECYQAYTSGRAEANPVDNWYKGEMGFFDFYIIPLAKKLSECGVFGVSSDEYLNYAVRNRQEWEERGQEVVASMIEKVERREASQEVDCEGRREKAPLHNRGDDMTRMMHHLTRSSG